MNFACVRLSLGRWREEEKTIAVVESSGDDSTFSCSIVDIECIRFVYYWLS